MSDGRGEDPIKAPAARVMRFLDARKRYAGRERLMAVDGNELMASDLRALVEFVQSTRPEISARTKHGSVNPVPYNDPAWLADGETLVRRHTTEWVEVPDAGSR